MTSDPMLRNLALAALTVLVVGPTLATAPGPASAEVTADPAEATVFLRFACTEKVKEAPPDVDTTLFVPEKRVSWGSGVFVRYDGLLATTYHSLADLAKDERADVAGTTVTVGCDREDVTVGVFELDSITQALRGEQGKYEELADLRDADLADMDVLFLQADTRGHDVPWLCAPEAIALEDYKDMPITAAGVDNDRGQPEYVPREGKANNKWGAGEASKYLEMTPAAEKGMSGGPVVRRSDGALVGIVHGNRPSSNPLATVNYFVPLTKFGGHLRQYVDPCAPEVTSSFEELLVLFDPKGENYIPEISDNKFRPVIEGTRDFLEAVFEGAANVVVGNRSYLKTALSDPDYLIDAWADDERAHDLIKPGGKRKGILVKMIDQGTAVHLYSKLFSASDEPRPLAYEPWPLDNARPGLTPEEHTEQFGHHLVRELESKDVVGFKPDPIFIDCIAPHDERGISPDVEKKLHNLSKRLAWLMDTDEEWRDLYWQSPDQGICASLSNEPRRSRLERLGLYPMPRYFLDTDVIPSRGDMLFIEVSGRFRWGALERIGVHEVAAALDVSEGEDCLSSQTPPTMECSLKNFLAEKLRKYGQFAPGGR